MKEDLTEITGNFQFSRMFNCVTNYLHKLPKKNLERHIPKYGRQACVMNGL